MLYIRTAVRRKSLSMAACIPRKLSVMQLQKLDENASSTGQTPQTNRNTEVVNQYMAQCLRPLVDYYQDGRPDLLPIMVLAVAAQPVHNAQRETSVIVESHPRYTCDLRAAARRVSSSAVLANVDSPLRPSTLPADRGSFPTLPSGHLT